MWTGSPPGIVAIAAARFALLAVSVPAFRPRRRSRPIVCASRWRFFLFCPRNYAPGEGLHWGDTARSRSATCSRRRGAGRVEDAANHRPLRTAARHGRADPRQRRYVVLKRLKYAPSTLGATIHHFTTSSMRIFSRSGRTSRVPAPVGAAARFYGSMRVLAGPAVRRFGVSHSLIAAVVGAGSCSPPRCRWSTPREILKRRGTFRAIGLGRFDARPLTSASRPDPLPRVR